MIPTTKTIIILLHAHPSEHITASYPLLYKMHVFHHVFTRDLKRLTAFTSCPSILDGGRGGRERGARYEREREEREEQDTMRGRGEEIEVKKEDREREKDGMRKRNERERKWWNIFFFRIDSTNSTYITSGDVCMCMCLYWCVCVCVFFTFWGEKVNLNCGVSSGVEDLTGVNLSDGHPDWKREKKEVITLGWLIHICWICLCSWDPDGKTNVLLFQITFFLTCIGKSVKHHF